MCDDCGVNRNSNSNGKNGRRTISAGSPAKRKSPIKPIYSNTNNGDKYEEPVTYLKKTLKLWVKIWKNVPDIPSEKAFYDLYLGRYPDSIKIYSYPISKDNLLIMYTQMVQSKYER